MRVRVQGSNQQLTLSMDSDQFLAGPMASCLCAANRLCPPEQAVRDHLRPDVNAYDDDGVVTQAVEEACMLACDSATYDAASPQLQIAGIELEHEDVTWARQLLLGLHVHQGPSVPKNAA
jgi:hypothetical protein